MIPYVFNSKSILGFFIQASRLARSRLALAESKLNIILILADDLGYGDLSVYNPSSKIPTPYLNQLAAQGMRFTDAHSPSSVCTPTRYGILTGRYAWRTKLKQGVLDGYSPFLIEKDRVTLASLLRRQGYRTAGIGKWHLGLGDGEKTDYSQPLRPGPNAAGFDEFSAYLLHWICRPISFSKMNASWKPPVHPSLPARCAAKEEGGSGEPALLLRISSMRPCCPRSPKERSLYWTASS